MNVYFSCSITGGRQDELVYQAIVAALLAAEHTVPTAHLSESSVTLLETKVSPEEVYQRDMAWVEGCDALVAEVSTPSHGVGYEIAAALMLGKPVLCCYQRGRKVSKMITGNSHPGLRLCAYECVDEAVEGVAGFLAGLTLDRA
jgi:nucleoside 2-deoxyribosyltransferase